MKLNRFTMYAWGVLVYNLVVILWGAYVRATGSGAGCGSHWPLCNGEVIPQTGQTATLIEFTHRLSSGLALIAVVILFVWARRAFVRGHPARLGAGLSLLFVITEALVGAGLVLFGWTAEDASAGRAISIVVHLLNTYLLVGALSLTAWWSTSGRTVQLVGRWRALWILLPGLAGSLLVGASGALTALGDTLFPAQSLAEGLQQDFSQGAHFLERLRVLHPTIAIIVSLYLIVSAGVLASRSQDAAEKRLARILRLAVAVQVGAGVLNLFLLAPVWMQLVHLLLADLNWISLVLLSAASLSAERQPVTAVRANPAIGGLTPEKT